MYFFLEGHKSYFKILFGTKQHQIDYPHCDDLVIRQSSQNRNTTPLESEPLTQIPLGNK